MTTGITVTALVPAHNEAGTIAAAIAGLNAQTRRPDRIAVIADNCSDDTAAIALAAGAEVFTTVGNTRKKAGALNQAIAAYLRTAHDDDVILIQDADSLLSPLWIKTALPLLARAQVGTVGGIFYTAHEHRLGLIGELQRMEYVRYARQIARHGERAYVLTGTATALRAGVLRHLAAAYSNGELPGGIPGETTFYTLTSITEDSFMTLAIKSLGYETLSPMECWVCTRVTRKVVGAGQVGFA